MATFNIYLNELTIEDELWPNSRRSTLSGGNPAINPWLWRGTGSVTINPKVAGKGFTAKWTVYKDGVLVGAAGKQLEATGGTVNNSNFVLPQSYNQQGDDSSITRAPGVTMTAAPQWKANDLLGEGYNALDTYNMRFGINQDMPSLLIGLLTGSALSTHTLIPSPTLEHADDQALAINPLPGTNGATVFTTLRAVASIETPQSALTRTVHGAIVAWLNESVS